MVCPPATSEARARRPRSSANYSDSSTNLLTSTKVERLEENLRYWGKT
jgi:hypothetical protein